LTYNKARQASITNEILEIVGGAEVERIIFSLYYTKASHWGFFYVYIETFGFIRRRPF
jgi:hypothetical protein